jgi:hypothetical protein
MDPFRNYRHVIPAVTRHCPLGGCAVCCSHAALVHREFTDLISGSWTLAELDLLSRAAHSALL